MEVYNGKMDLRLFSDCTFENNILYFYSALNGFLGKWDIFGDNRMKYYELLSEPHNFIRTVSHRGKLYSLESSGKALYIFNIDSGRHDVLPIPYNTYEYDNFTDLVVYDDKIMIFPKHQSEIMVLDTTLGSSEKVQYSADTSNTAYCGCLHKNCYYLFPENGGYVFSIDLDNHHERSVVINQVEDRFVHSVSYDGNIFLLTVRGQVYIWDVTEMLMSEIYDFRLPVPAYRIAVTERRIVVLPFHQRHDIFILDRNTGNSYVYSGYPEDFSYRAAEVWNAYEGMTDIGDFYLYAMRAANYALLINKISGGIEWRRPRNMDGQIMRIMAERGKQMFFEGNYSLKDYVDYVADAC